MTVKQVGEITGKNETTILRRIKKLFPGMEITQGIPLDLSEFEAYRVLKSYQSDFRVLQNAGVSPAKRSSSFLPNGSQLKELRFFFEKGAISSKDIRRLLGLDSRNDFRAMPALPAPDPDRFDQVGYLLAGRMREKARAAEEEDLRQGKLFPSR